MERRGHRGGFRFLNRVWPWRGSLRRGGLKAVPPCAPVSALGGETVRSGEGLRRKEHDTARRVTRDMENKFQFNTAIAALMEW